MTTSTSSRQRGFTVIELIVVAGLFILAGALTFIQINDLRTAEQNSTRKTAINAMYFALEEVYYTEHKSYPEKLTSAVLPSIDPVLFTDPDGFTLGKDALTTDELQKIIEENDASEDTVRRLASLESGKGPNYHYDATNCDTDGKCKSYTLRADLSGEAQYVKKSRR